MNVKINNKQGHISYDINRTRIENSVTLHQYIVNGKMLSWRITYIY